MTRAYALRLLCMLIVSSSASAAADVLAGAKQVTHRCRLHIAAEQQELQLSCHPQPGTPASCNLVVYYSSTGIPLRSITSFGIPTYRLPKLPKAALRSAAVNKTEDFLNRTEPIYNIVNWPLLFFHGGPSCHAYFKSPVIRDVDLPKQINETTQVLAFGGGMSATLEGGEIVNNSAIQGVMVLANTSLTVLGTNISFNNVRQGSLYGSYTSQLFLRNVTLSHNKATEGAAMYLVNSRAAVIDSSIISNTATKGGGALYVKGNSSLFMTSSSVSSNTSPTGGALRVSDSPMVAVWRCQILENTAQSSAPTLLTDTYYSLGVGGGLFLQRSTADIRGSNVTGNKAVMDGGAILMHLTRLNITNSSISGNTAYRHGGAFYVAAEKGDRSTNSTLRVAGSLLENNLAQGNGGGMMLERRAHVHLVNTTVRSCKAWNSGDGICTILGDSEDAGKQDDLQTQLVLVDTKFEGADVNKKLFIGPYFNITFSNPRELNRSSPGVVWHRRLCSKGEYVLNDYCMPCPTFQFSTYEAYPGHTTGNCIQAPNSSYAPGGAVLVALPKFWHGFNKSIKECSDCPPLVARLNDIRRCPNPSACQHDYQELAQHHPNSMMSYSTRQPSKAQQASAPVHRYVQQTVTEQPPQEFAVNGATQDAQLSKSQQHAEPVPAEGHGTSTSRYSSRSLDITKALLTYTQWAMLILTLPIEWHPWAHHKSHTNASGGTSSGPISHQLASGVLGVLFGRAVPLDCFFQAWGWWQSDTMQQIVTRVMARAAGRAVIIPLVLFLSVVILQLLFLALRQPLLWALDVLCTNSAFFRTRVSGGVSGPNVVLGPDQLEVSADVDVPVDGDEDKPQAGLDTATSAGSSKSKDSTSSTSTSFISQFSKDATRAAISTTLVDSAVAAALAVMLFSYSAIANVSLGLLMCIKVGGLQRWILDVRLQCPTSYHTTWSAAAVGLGGFLLCVCIAWPVGIACLLVRKAHRGELLRLDGNRTPSSGETSAAAAARTTSKLAVRYADYDVDYEGLDDAVNTDSMSHWYQSTLLFKTALRRMRMYAVLVWDSILELHKFTLVVVSLCVMLHELHQLTLTMMVLGIYLVLVLLVEPWRSVHIWRLQVAALVLLLASCMGIAVCSVNDVTSYYEAQVLKAYQAVIPWFIVAANACYLAVVIVLLVRSVLRETPKISDLRKYLRKRWNLLRRRQQTLNRLP